MDDIFEYLAYCKNEKVTPDNEEALSDYLKEKAEKHNTPEQVGTYLRLFKKFSPYSNYQFPICDFLNDIRDNTIENYNKNIAYDDIETIFDTFMEFYRLNQLFNKVIYEETDGMTLARLIAVRLLDDSSLTGEKYYEKEDEYTNTIQEAIDSVVKIKKKEIGEEEDD